MQGGRLRGKVKLLQPNSKRDQGRPGEFLDPLVIATPWAEIEPLTGANQDKSGQVVTQTEYRITIRYRDGVTSRMLVEFRKQVLNIRAAFDPDQKRRKLQLICYERNDGR